ncbi:hypothetical protein N5853_02675 [Bartonella sp. HY329]|uniref:hypothetical protein n=1 Tax=unclassified Bartonella TaxID=2645622 RepID=UPI0021C65E24|nr:MULTISPECIES: hypothetical protein [unclassified Bartonella]UXM95556.1 hypothetical protein N5853_02675 [Bartonella sp. HY329]UXN09881.1 hypothetical protein N5852_02685 [Bartonella sp. HY328]
MHFFILQFLGSFAIFMAFAQFITFVQPLFFIRQALLAGRYTSIFAVTGFFLSGMLACCILGIFPHFYLNVIEPYRAYFFLALLAFCFFYCFICLTGRLTRNNPNAIILFLTGAFLGIICFIFCSSFLVMFSLSLGRIGVTSYIFENFAISIGGVFLILTLVYYYLILLLTLAPIQNKLNAKAAFIDPFFAVGFAAIGFWLLP